MTIRNDQNKTNFVKIWVQSGLFSKYRRSRFESKIDSLQRCHWLVSAVNLVYIFLNNTWYVCWLFGVGWLWHRIVKYRKQCWEPTDGDVGGKMYKIFIFELYHFESRKRSDISTSLYVNFFRPRPLVLHGHSGSPCISDTWNNFRA